MESSTLSNTASFSLPQLDLLQYFVGRSQPPLPQLHALQDPVFVGLDVEWYECDKNYITELGFAVMDPRKMDHDPGAGADVMAWAALWCMNVEHIRLRENAHMLNTKFCHGRPDKFAFGTTRFVEHEQVSKILPSEFMYPIVEGAPELGHRPVIFVGHAVDNDIAMIKQHFGVDLNSYGLIAATLDTQILAQQAGICPAWQKLNLRALLNTLGIEEPYLHTAGNDVAYTMIAAFLTAAHGMVDPDTLVKDYAYRNRQNAEDLKYHLSEKPQPSWGVATFCTKCDSEDHFSNRCNSPVHCDICELDPARRQHAHTHMTKKCGFGNRPPTPRTPSASVVIPCEPCSMSPEQKRHTKAHTHTTEQCGFAHRKDSVSGVLELFLDVSALIPPYGNADHIAVQSEYSVVMYDTAAYHDAFYHDGTYHDGVYHDGAYQGNVYQDLQDAAHEEYLYYDQNIGYLTAPQPHL